MSAKRVCFLRPTIREDEVVDFVADLATRSGQEVTYSRAAGLHVVTTTGDTRRVAEAARALDKGEVLGWAAVVQEGEG